MAWFTLYKMAQIASENKDALILTTVVGFALAIIIAIWGFVQCLKGLNHYEAACFFGGRIKIILGMILGFLSFGIFGILRTIL